MIPYTKHSIDAKDIQAVNEVLNGDYLTSGPVVEEFEDALCDYTGAKFAVVVSSGTAALHLLQAALRVDKDSQVIVPTVTFVASANSTLYCGGEPVLVDINTEDRSFHISPESIEREIIKKPNVRGVIAVHLGGPVSPIEDIHKIAKKYGLFVIEDACHSLGGQYRANDKEIHRVGSCKHSDATIFSFHPAKQVCAGEGGVVLTNNSELAEMCRLLRSHSLQRNSPIGNKISAWPYEVNHLGFNYRITELQAALGLSQLKQLDQKVESRRVLLKRYKSELDDIGELTFQNCKDFDLTSFHLAICLAERRDSLREALLKEEIGTQIHYIPNHLQPFYQRTFAYKYGDMPQAENYFERCVSLPLFPTLTVEDQDRVIGCIRRFYGN